MLGNKNIIFMYHIIFYLFCVLVISLAVITIYTKNLVRAVFTFFLTLFAISGLYVFSLADFVAITQIVIYVGGVLVLFLFGLMLSDKKLLDMNSLQKTTIRLGNLRPFVGLVIAVSFLCLLVFMWFELDMNSITWMHTNPIANAKQHEVSNIGIALMTKFLIPFEVIAVFLLMALIGASHLMRKEVDVD